MRIETIKHHRRVIMEPGEYYASREPVTISTLLGSCVSACIFDPMNKVIGMNHFMLSNHRYPKHLPMIEADAGRYGIHSMELLINEMLKLGAQKRFFKAKAFGGSTILKQSIGAIGNFFCVGEVNSKFIKEFLDKEEIPLVAEDLGGNEGRVIHFSSGDHAVYVRKIKSAHRSRQLAMRDRDCWLHAIGEQEKVKSLADNVELWV
jgi:chemotaxis protein CheD